MGVKFGVAAALLCAAFGVQVAGFDPGSKDPGLQQKTTRDKVYAKVQAARGADLYAKHCERCHDPAKVPEGKKPGPPTVGPKFIEVWMDRSLGELFGSILNTMPSDGSMTLTADQTLDLVAYLLQANAYPEGSAPLKNDDAMKATVIVK
jgi:S-disulfanyl-L-cysteine oxidoreductase SoxD